MNKVEALSCSAQGYNFAMCIKVLRLRTVYIIDLLQCNNEQLNIVLDVIKRFSNSARIDRRSLKNTEELTVSGARAFLADLSQDDSYWRLLSFYSYLFDYVHSTNYLLLYGTGNRGFSIRVGIKSKGDISLCTLWANGKIEFGLKR